MKTYLVGGAVRDALLGLPVTDRDWVVVGATPKQLLERGYQQAGKEFPVFLHPVSHEEYALARTERKCGPGHQGFKTYFSADVTLEQDLQRRDLTINAMAQSPEGELIDPWGGAADLAARRLRHVSQAFSEDPLRVLRIARFAARLAPLGFTIANDTFALMKAMVASGELDSLTPERVWKETEKALGCATAQHYFQVLQDCGALALLFPELATLFTQSKNNLGQLSLKALHYACQLSDEGALRFSTLCYGLGQISPSKATIREVIVGLSQRLRLPNHYRDLTQLVALYAPQVEGWSQLSAARQVQLFDDLDAWRKPERIEQLALASQAISAAQQGQLAGYPQGEQLRQAFKRAQQVPVAPIIAAGFKGPQVKEELNRQRIAQLHPKI